eukprot:GHRR01033851.1.p1 GENE.GHRR01033851.1~~GHRR01033851.1.p1  ORF type:complete len:142 (+),score=23.51 GHRR01033851.1:554-979(+)
MVIALHLFLLCAQCPLQSCFGVCFPLRAVSQPVTFTFQASTMLSPHMVLKMWHWANSLTAADEAVHHEQLQHMQINAHLFLFCLKGSLQPGFSVSGFSELRGKFVAFINQYRMIFSPHMVLKTARLEFQDTLLKGKPVACR